MFLRRTGLAGSIQVADCANMMCSMRTFPLPSAPPRPFVSRFAGRQPPKGMLKHNSRGRGFVLLGYGKLPLAMETQARVFPPGFQSPSNLSGGKERFLCLVTDGRPGKLVRIKKHSSCHFSQTKGALTHGTCFSPNVRIVPDGFQVSGLTKTLNPHESFESFKEVNQAPNSPVR